MTPIRVLIADDDQLYRRALYGFLASAPDVTVVGTLDDGEGALAAYDELRPDVVVVDVFMPRTGGVEGTRQITARFPRAQVLVLTAHEDASVRRSSIEAGASAFLTKSKASRELLPTIRRLAAAGSEGSPESGR